MTRQTNAQEVVELLRGIRAKVNLIALNPGPGIASPLRMRSRSRFSEVFCGEAGIPAFFRRPRGRDILCRVRPTQAYGRDCHSTGTVASLGLAGAGSAAGSSTRRWTDPSALDSRHN